MCVVFDTLDQGACAISNPYNGDFDLAHLNIGKGQLSVLYIALHNPGLSQKELSQHLSIDKSTTAKSLEKLIQAGFVYKVRCETDKRMFHIYPSKKAMDIMGDIDRIIAYHETILHNGFNRRETERLNSYLQRCRDNIKSEILKRTEQRV